MVPQLPLKIKLYFKGVKHVASGEWVGHRYATYKDQLISTCTKALHKKMVKFDPKLVSHLHDGKSLLEEIIKTINFYFYCRRQCYKINFNYKNLN